MLDYLESKIARSEYEERVRAITGVTDIDAELNRRGGHWQAQAVGTLLSSLAKGVGIFAAKFNRRRSPAGDSRIIEPETSVS